MDAADCKVNNTRRLSRYLLEHIFALPNNTPLLLLVGGVSDDKNQFSLDTNKSAIIKQLPRRVIAEKEYFQFCCILDKVLENKAVVAGHVYSLRCTQRNWRI